ncbi:M23 family metallopeptidase [Riemerella anatipestifer]|uniref:M23 family metallopeptidase n=1 Tax=Riemerella anatipestifer TaxID=34085 RepID=UPI0021D59265|nr:M23 family metallopeptidase [Riemerella anatipestifer]MCU7567419.1 M23 family metallopeptidase [Riemerella anatipestifer]
MKNINNKYILGGLFLIVLLQSLFIIKLYSEKDDKAYEVNLVKINTQKDSVDYSKMKQDLGLIHNTVKDLHRFLAAKQVVNSNLENLAQDSLNNSIYLAQTTNRYSQYLVDLQEKLQTVPLGIPTEGYISSQFGKRKNPIPTKTALASVKPAAKASTDSTTTATTTASPKEPEQMQFHKGIDIAVSLGKDIKSAAAGTILFAEEKSGYGKCVIISHGNGLATLYGHLSQVLVKANDKIKAGETIAKSGNTGRSTGPHLHYEVHKNGTPINPKLFLTL